MNFSLIICTYKRIKALQKLLVSVENQRLFPDEILIVDGSPDNQTRKVLEELDFRNLKYFQVEEKDRGLTRQRNFGIQQLSSETEIVCFLDDDVVLESDYFQQLIKTYKTYPDTVGVGGYIKNEVSWRKTEDEPNVDEFKYDDYIRELGSRNLLRKKIGLLSDQPPGVMPEFSNGFSIGFLPPSGNIYKVEFFMGCAMSFDIKKNYELRFSNFFEGYGLYEDMDFCLRASKTGQLYVNTAACLDHEHEESGRPNKFNYGKMVVRNGWYVWRVKYNSPSLKARLKWHSIAFLLTLVRLGNVITTSDKKAALTEALGRIAGWFSLLINKPNPKKFN